MLNIAVLPCPTLHCQACCASQSIALHIKQNLIKTFYSFLYINLFNGLFMFIIVDVVDVPMSSSTTYSDIPLSLSYVAICSFWAVVITLFGVVVLLFSTFISAKKCFQCHDEWMQWSEKSSFSFLFNAKVMDNNISLTLIYFLRAECECFLFVCFVLFYCSARAGGWYPERAGTRFAIQDNLLSLDTSVKCWWQLTPAICMASQTLTCSVST